MLFVDDPVLMVPSAYIYNGKQIFTFNITITWLQCCWHLLLEGDEWADK